MLYFIRKMQQGERIREVRERDGEGEEKINKRIERMFVYLVVLSACYLLIWLQEQLLNTIHNQ